MLPQHRVLRNLRKNKHTVLTKPDKGNGIVILDRKLCNNAIEEIISDTSKFEKPNEDPTFKREASLQRFLLSSPIVPNDYSCKNTFSFDSQIKNANLSKKNSCLLRCK